MFDMFRQFVGGGKSYFGSRLQVPQLPSMEDILKTGTSANVANLPKIGELASGVNKLSFDQVSQMLERAAPGFMGGIASATKSASSLARGEIPEDVARNVLGTSASKSLAGGYFGSGLARNATARDLGLTSLNLMSEGQNRLMGIGSFAKGAFPTFDFSTAFFSPAQMLDYTYSQFQRNLLQAKSDASPDPVARGRADQEMALFGEIMGAVGGFSGGGRGGGGSSVAWGQGGSGGTW